MMGLAIAVVQMSPAPGPRLQPDEVIRLQQGSDVSVFTEILGEPGYRRPILLGPELEKSPSLEWGWARTGEYMVRAVVSPAAQVEAFSITTLSPTFTAPLHPLADIADKPPMLGKTTFTELEVSTFDQPFQPDGRDAFGIGANGRWYFSEYYSIPRPLNRTFVATYGSTGEVSGFDAGDELVDDQLVSFETCQTQPCLGDVTDVGLLSRAREQWPITTFTDLGDIADVPEYLEVLGREPFDEDIALADRG